MEVLDGYRLVVVILTLILASMNFETGIKPSKPWGYIWTGNCLYWFTLLIWGLAS